MTPRPLRAAILTVGDELLLGTTVDTNGAWLGVQLAEAGLPVVWRFVLGDRESDIRQGLRAALQAAEVVIVTGGLGPTPDDITRESVAAELGQPLHTDPAVLRSLEARFREYGYRNLPPDNARQALVPEGGEVLANERGSAPGLWLSTDGGVVVLLPGVPVEMQDLLTKTVLPRIRERFGDRLSPVQVRVIRTTGIAESVLSERLREQLPIERGPVEVAFLPHLTGVDLRFTAKDVSAEEASQWFDRLESPLEPLLEPFRYEAPSGDLVEAVADRLLAEGLTVAVAESCTGGLVGARLTARPGSSGYFLGGVIAYANESKVRDLGIPLELIAEKGAVSQEVAEAMARGVARRFGSDVGLGVTGIAGPAGGSEEKPVGLVWYACSIGGEVRSAYRRALGNREDIRIRAAQSVLALLFRGLVEGTAPSRGLADRERV